MRRTLAVGRLALLDGVTSRIGDRRKSVPPFAEPLCVKKPIEVRAACPCSCARCHDTVFGTHRHHHLEPTATQKACRRLHRSLQHAPAPPFTRPATTRRHRRCRPARQTPPSRENGPLWRTHQRVPKCRLTSHDTVFGTHTQGTGMSWLISKPTSAVFSDTGHSQRNIVQTIIFTLRLGRPQQ